MWFTRSLGGPRACGAPPARHRFAEVKEMEHVGNRAAQGLLAMTALVQFGSQFCGGTAVGGTGASKTLCSRCSW